MQSVTLSQSAPGVCAASGCFRQEAGNTYLAKLGTVLAHQGQRSRCHWRAMRTCLSPCMLWMSPRQSGLQQEGVQVALQCSAGICVAALRTPDHMKSSVAYLQQLAGVCAIHHYWLARIPCGPLHQGLPACMETSSWPPQKLRKVLLWALPVHLCSQHHVEAYVQARCRALAMRLTSICVQPALLGWHLGRSLLCRHVRGTRACEHSRHTRS